MDASSINESRYPSTKLVLTARKSKVLEYQTIRFGERNVSSAIRVSAASLVALLPVVAQASSGTYNGSACHPAWWQAEKWIATNGFTNTTNDFLYVSCPMVRDWLNKKSLLSVISINQDTSSTTSCTLVAASGRDGSRVFNAQMITGSGNIAPNVNWEADYLAHAEIWCRLASWATISYYLFWDQ